MMSTSTNKPYMLTIPKLYYTPMMTHSSWHDDIRREFALEFAENSNQQTNWQTAVITSLSRVSGGIFFPRPTTSCDDDAKQQCKNNII